MLAYSSSKLNKIPNNYSIPIFLIFLETWRRTKGLKKAFWSAFFLILLAMILPSAFISLLNIILSKMYPAVHLENVLIDCLRVFFFLVADVGGSFLALQHAREHSISFEMALDVYKVWKILVFFGILICLMKFILNVITDYSLVYISTLNLNLSLFRFAKYFEILLIACITIYVFQLIVMAMLLVLDKNVPIINSLIISFKSINKHCFKNISLGLFTGLSAILFTILTLGIGLIWLQPMLSLTHAIQYRRIFNEHDSVI